MGNVKQKEVFISYENTANGSFQVISDKETGEILSEQWINKSNKKPGRKPNSEKIHFIKIYKTNLHQIVKDKKLEMNEAGLLFCLLPYIGWQTAYIVNPVTGKNINESEIAHELEKDRSHIHDILEKLVSKGMISKVVRGKGLPNHFMININIAFWGKAIDDLSHVDVFNDCAYVPEIKIKYNKSTKTK